MNNHPQSCSHTPPPPPCWVPCSSQAVSSPGQGCPAGLTSTTHHSPVQNVATAAARQSSALRLTLALPLERCPAAGLARLSLPLDRGCPLVAGGPIMPSAAAARQRSSCRRRAAATSAACLFQGSRDCTRLLRRVKAGGPGPRGGRPRGWTSPGPRGTDAGWLDGGVGGWGGGEVRAAEPVFEVVPGPGAAVGGAEVGRRGP